VFLPLSSLLEHPTTAITIAIVNVTNRSLLVLFYTVLLLLVVQLLSWAAAAYIVDRVHCVDEPRVQHLRVLRCVMEEARRLGKEAGSETGSEYMSSTPLRLTNQLFAADSPLFPLHAYRFTS
jgi:hypothetical protein